jgi:hypothetical protein
MRRILLTAILALIFVAPASAETTRTVGELLEFLFDDAVDHCQTLPGQYVAGCVRAIQEPTKKLRLAVYTDPDPGRLIETWEFCTSHPRIIGYSETEPDIYQAVMIACIAQVYPRPAADKEKAQ